MQEIFVFFFFTLKNVCIFAKNIFLKNVQKQAYQGKNF